jgi:hypothetical protein
MGKHLVVIMTDPIMFMNFSKVLYFHSIIIMCGGGSSSLYVKSPLNYTVSSVKISIAFFLLRLSTKTPYNRFLWGIIAFIVVFTLVCAMTLIFHCLPVQASWDSRLLPPPFGNGTAKCYSLDIFRNLGLMNSGEYVNKWHNTLLTSFSFQYNNRCPLCHAPNSIHMETAAQCPNKIVSHRCFVIGMVCCSCGHHQSCPAMACPRRSRLDCSQLISSLELYRVLHWDTGRFDPHVEAALQLGPG